MYPDHETRLEWSAVMSSALVYSWKGALSDSCTCIRSVARSLKSATDATAVVGPSEAEAANVIAQRSEGPVSTLLHLLTAMFVQFIGRHHLSIAPGSALDWLVTSRTDN